MRRLILALAITPSSLAAADRIAPPEPPATPPMSQPTAPVVRPPPPGHSVGFAPRMKPMPQPPVVPQPAPEIAKRGKELAGTYKCKGVVLHPDGSSEPMQATVTIKLDLDNAWIQTSLVEEARPNPIKWTGYTTFDATAKQWTRIQLVSTSAHVVSTSLGDRDGKWTWEGAAASPMGTTQVRDFEQHDAKQLKLWGEALASGSWQKQYEATCKK